MHEVKLPRLSDEHDESSIVMWFKQEGSQVEKGEALLEVQTEKAVSQIESEVEGVLEKISIKRGEAAQVGDVLCVINTDVSGSDESEAQPEEESTSSASETKESEQTFVRIAPRLRRLAKELKVDLTKISGTGRNVKITEEDIRSAGKETASASANGQALSDTRRIIAERMRDSLQNSAQLTETTFADVTQLAKKRDALTPKLSWNTLIVKATIRALQEHPNMNATYQDGQLQHHDEINLGIATDTDEGLLVPVIKNANNYTLEDLEKEIDYMADLARRRQLTSEQMSESIFTITSLGSFGIQFFTPIINPPEVAILGIGMIENYLYKQNGEVMDGLQLPLSLTIDHQVIDGAPGARFLQTLVNKLEHPDDL